MPGSSTTLARVARRFGFLLAVLPLAGACEQVDASDSPAAPADSFDRLLGGEPSPVEARIEAAVLVDGARPDRRLISHTRLAVLGDVVDDWYTSHARANARLIAKHNPAVSGVLLCGDVVRYDPTYEPRGTSLLAYFKKYYAPAAEAGWARLDPLVYPTPGNHEYEEPGARGYFEYFAARARAIKAMASYHGFIDVAGKGYYSFDVSGWHVIGLNSNCDQAGGCAEGSPEESWLEGDLARHRGMPVIAYFHHPRFTCTAARGAARNGDMYPFWADLYHAHADFVFVGHTHFFQRWKPLDKAVNAGVDTSQGLTQIVVGGGGSESHEPCTDASGRPADPRIAAQIGGTSGIGSLFLDLGSDGSYAWEYRLISTGAVFDSGRGVSHNAP